MAVGFKVGYYWFQVGTSDFLHSFFSTICIRLEHGKWGRVYPKLMGELYQGCLKNQDLNEGLEELRKVRKELKNFSPSDGRDLISVLSEAMNEAKEMQCDIEIDNL